VTEIVLPAPDGRGGSARVARTPADYPIVSVSAWRPASGPLHLAATGVSSLPIRLVAAEAALEGDWSEASIEAAAGAAGRSCDHPGDFRGSAAYRAEMAAVLTRRAVRQVLMDGPL
jgi:carbon-monoxide dehydrogenase medium subunit